MPPKMRRNLPGAFLARYLGDGAWRLSREGPAFTEVFVRGAESRAAEIFGSTGLRDIGIEWREGTVLLTLRSEQRIEKVGAQSAIVHEPLPHLYEALPLVSLDAKARRFWRWVFRLIRVPGGRSLLGLLARHH
ncbi:MAG TPA: hypothetical protein VNW26_05300 [Steroidobacteraceae bacterium]|jgi:hypothetical protein|nr:hypothetical protein [Steroidobacteraceae bacterium]